MSVNYIGFAMPFLLLGLDSCVWKCCLKDDLKHNKLISSTTVKLLIAIFPHLLGLARLVRTLKWMLSDWSIFENNKSFKIAEQYLFLHLSKTIKQNSILNDYK